MKKLGLLFVATLGLSTNIKAIDTIGIYYPSTINSNYDGEFENEDYSFETKDSGIGIIFKHKSHDNTTLTESLEYTTLKIKDLHYDDEKGVDIGGEITRINFIFTWQNDIITKKDYKVWFAPRFNIAGESYSEYEIKRDGIELGIAPVIGVDYQINEKISVALDIDYQFAYSTGKMEIDDEKDSYKENINRLSSRFYVFYKF